MNDLLCVYHTGNMGYHYYLNLQEKFAKPQGNYSVWGVNKKNFTIQTTWENSQQIYVFRKPCWSSGGVPETLFTVPSGNQDLYLDNITRRLSTVLHLINGEEVYGGKVLENLDNLPSPYQLQPLFTEISEGGVSVKFKQSMWGNSFHVGKFIFMQSIKGLCKGGRFWEITHDDFSLRKLLREIRHTYNAPRFEENFKFYVKN